VISVECIKRNINTSILDLFKYRAYIDAQIYKDFNSLFLPHFLDSHIILKMGAFVDIVNRREILAKEAIFLYSYTISIYSVSILR